MFSGVIGRAQGQPSVVISSACTRWNNRAGCRMRHTGSEFAPIDPPVLFHQHSPKPDGPRFENADLHFPHKHWKVVRKVAPKHTLFQSGRLPRTRLRSPIGERLIVGHRRSAIDSPPNYAGSLRDLRAGPVNRGKCKSTMEVGEVPYFRQYPSKTDQRRSDIAARDTTVFP